MIAQGNALGFGFVTHYQALKGRNNMPPSLADTILSITVKPGFGSAQSEIGNRKSEIFPC